MMDLHTRKIRVFDMFLYGVLLLVAVNNVHAEDKKKLNVVTILEPPYVMRDAVTGKFSGLLIDVLAEAGIVIDHISTPMHDQYGYEEHPGNFTGAIGDLIAGKYDIAVAPFTIRSKRAEHVTFSQPVIHHGYAALYKIPKDVNWDFDFKAAATMLKPFSPSMWCVIVVLFVISSIALFFIRRFSPYEDDLTTTSSSRPQSNDSSFSHGAMQLLGSMSFRNASQSPRSISGRVLTAFWWIFSVMTVSAYVAALVVLLFKTKPHLRNIPFSDVDEMMQGKEVKLLGVKNSATYRYISGHKGFYERKVYEYWKANWDTTMVNSFEEALKMLDEGDGKYALFMDEALADHLSNRMPCDKMFVGPPVGDETIGFACQKGSTICDDLNHKILQLQEEGKMEGLREKWFWSKCHQTTETFFGGEAFFDNFDGKQPGLMSPHSITVKRFTVAFVIAIIGVVLAIVFLVLEILYSRRKGNIHRRLKTSSRTEDSRGIQDQDFSIDQDA